MTTQQITMLYLSVWLSNIPQGPRDKSLLDNNPLIATTTLPEDTLHAITGNLLGDGSLRRKVKNGQPVGNALFEMNKGHVAKEQAFDTFNKYYKSLSGKGFRVNTYFSNSLGITVTQYHIFTQSLPVFTSLHSIWYLWNPDLRKFVKTVPKDISLMFSPLSLAHWIMDDGYYTDKTIVLCTDNFTKQECESLQALLLEYSIQSGLIIQKGKYRIRLYRSSVPIVIELVKSHMHKDFLYKLGL